MSVYFGFLVATPQEQRGVKERFGKYVEYLDPGLSFKIPLVDQIYFRDIRERTVDIPAQTVITKDNVEVEVDGVIWIRVSPDEGNVRKSFYEVDDHVRAISELCHTNIREIVAKLTFDEALTSRDKIGHDLLANLRELVTNWGVRIEKVEIKEIDPPNDIKQAMHKQKTAEQERRAARLEATGRKEAAKEDKEAAILKAEGSKQSNILVAEGKAQAIELVNVAAEEFFVGNAVELKRLETAENAIGKNSKIILAPGMDGLLANLMPKVMTNGKKD